MTYNYLKPADIKGKTVLLRVDLNEEVDEFGKLVDDFRIISIVPVIKFLQENNAKIVILSHAGRPEGKRNDNMTLRPMAECLAKHLDVKFVETDDQVVEYPLQHLVFVKGDLTKPATRKAVQNMQAKDIVLFDNLSF